MKYTQTPALALDLDPKADRLHEEVTILHDRIAQLDAHGNGSGYEKRRQGAYVSKLQDRLCEQAICKPRRRFRSSPGPPHPAFFPAIHDLVCFAACTRSPRHGRAILI